jgi:hypothetical protein
VLARKHLLIAAVSLFGILMAAGCGVSGDFRPNAAGKEGEILLVMDSSHWNGPIGVAIKETVGAYIGTLPAPEREFDLRVVELSSEKDLDFARKQKNVIFVAPLSDSTNEAQYIKNVFDEAAQQAILRGDGAVISRENLWRRGQQVFYITGADTAAIVDVIQRRGDELTRSFNQITRQRMTEDMFDKGRQLGIEERLMEKHGFAVNAQHDYQIATDTTRFVWMRRVLSDTWRSLVVYYVENADPGKLSPSWIYSTRDSLSQKYLQGNLGGWVEIDARRPLETENIDFLGRYGFETRGLWHMVGDQNGEIVEFGMGGPFVMYTFYDQATGRIYMIDGMVFAPGFDKREFLRQLEVIAHTFRTRRDAEARSRALASRDK